MLEDMNIKVFELPPSDDELALLGTTEEAPEDVEEAAGRSCFGGQRNWTYDRSSTHVYA